MSTYGKKKLFKKKIKQWHHEDFPWTTGQVLFSHVWYGSIFSAWNSMSLWSTHSVKGLIFPIVLSWSGGKYLMKPFHLRIVHSTVTGGWSGSWEAAYAIRYSLPRLHNNPEQKNIACPNSITKHFLKTRNTGKTLSSSPLFIMAVIVI